MLRWVRAGGLKGGEGPALAGVVGSGAKIDDEAAEELAGAIEHAAIVAGLAGGAYAAVAGGRSNTAEGDNATVGGGRSNSARGEHATIAGGFDNLASESHASVGGGYQNYATGVSATIGGGSINSADGPSATVGGGADNSALGGYITVGGGSWNQATGEYATVSGGGRNRATGEYSTVVGGSEAKASHYGEVAHASGAFENAGDAQASQYILRRETTSDGIWQDLYLDGSSTLFTLSGNRTVTFDIEIVGRSSGGESAGYHCWGAIELVGTTTTPLGSSCWAHGEDDAAWDVRLGVDQTKDALLVQVLGHGESIRWVAVMRTAEVSY